MASHESALHPRCRPTLGGEGGGREGRWKCSCWSHMEWVSRRKERLSHPRQGQSMAADDTPSSVLEPQKQPPCLLLRCERQNTECPSLIRLTAGRAQKGCAPESTPIFARPVSQRVNSGSEICLSPHSHPPAPDPSVNMVPGSYNSARGKLLVLIT